MYISLLLSPSRQEAMLFTCYANSTIPSSILARLVPVLWGHRLCFFLWLMYVELAKGDPDQHIAYLLYISTRQIHFSKITTKLEYRKSTFFCKLPMSSLLQSQTWVNTSATSSYPSNNNNSLISSVLVNFFHPRLCCGVTILSCEVLRLFFFVYFS